MNILMFGILFVMYFFIKTCQQLKLDSNKKYPALPASADIFQRTQYTILMRELFLAEEELAKQQEIARVNTELDAERRKNPTPEDKKFPDLPASASIEQKREYDALIQEFILAEQQLAKQKENTRVIMASASVEQKEKYDALIQDLILAERELAERLKNPSDQDKKDD